MYHCFVSFCFFFLFILIRNSGFDFKMENQSESVPTSTSSSTFPSSLDSSSIYRQNRKRKHSITDTDEILGVYDVRNQQNSGKQPDAEIANVNNTRDTGTMDGGAELRSSSNSAIFDAEIPTQTSNWNYTVFPKLHIETIPEVFPPYVVFSSYADFLENQKIKRSKIIATMNDHVSEQWELQDCFTYAIEHILDLDYEHIDHVPVDRVKELYKYTQSQALDEPSLEDWQKYFAERNLEDGSSTSKQKWQRYIFTFLC